MAAIRIYFMNFLTATPAPGSVPAIKLAGPVWLQNSFSNKATAARSQRAIRSATCSQGCGCVSSKEASPPHDVNREDAALMAREEIVDEVANNGIGFVS